MKNRQWILTSRPKPGPLTKECFEFRESEIAPLKEGEFLVKNRMLSFDPSQRFWMEADTYIPVIPLGEVMRASAVSEVVESRHSKFPVGARVTGFFDWQDYMVSNGQGMFPPSLVPNMVSDEAALSVFGMTGFTAYFGMEDIVKPKAGEIVVVSGASGATGSIAAQIARVRGANVIGIAGGERKTQWLIEKAGLFAAIDYKRENVAKRLRELAPGGINAYFDNVGGEILDAVLGHLATRARIAVCGGIATYNHDDDAGIHNYLNLVLKRAKMEGFLITDFFPRYPEAFEALGRLVGEGKIKYEVEINHGLENAPATLIQLFEGKNLGKQVLKL